MLPAHEPRCGGFTSGDAPPVIWPPCVKCLRRTEPVSAQTKTMLEGPIPVWSEPRAKVWCHMRIDLETYDLN